MVAFVLFYVQKNVDMNGRSILHGNRLYLNAMNGNQLVVIYLSCPHKNNACIVHYVHCYRSVQFPCTNVQNSHLQLVVETH